MNNALDRINKTKIDIMRHPRFCRFSGVMACGKTELSTDIPTAATNGWDKYFNEQFVMSLSYPQLRLVVLHETMHVAYRHLVMWRTLSEENAPLANIAMDHFVNLALMDMDNGEEFLAMPTVGVQPDPKYRGWSVLRIYDDLKQNPPEGEGSMDDHQWEEADESDATNPNPSNPTPKSREQARAAQIDQALRQGEILAKRRAAQLGLTDTPMLGDLLYPRVDWRKALREFVTETCAGRDESTWRKPNRRYLGDDVYLPSMQSATMSRLVVGVDTSGSCFDTPIATRFVSELAAILEQVKPAFVDVIYWDTEVAGHQTFENGQFVLADLKPTGGGGTNGAVLFDYLRAKQINPDAIVQLSDGHVGHWGHTTCPTLWALTERMQAGHGTTVYIGD